MPAQKRKAPATPASSDRRRSGRISSSGKKSQYFEPDSDSEDYDELGDGYVPEKKKTKNGKGRGRPSKKTKVESDQEDDDEAYDEEQESNNEAADADDDDDDEELVLGRVTIKPLVKMRDLDGVPYQDDRLHKNTFLFLKDLKANNKRSWLKAHDGEYRRSFKDWTTYLDTLTPKIIAADPTIPELPTKDIIFRIYRDVRFSKDQTPYKPHYSAAFSRTGRKGPYACYYLHCEPRSSSGGCHLSGGLWMPEREALAKLRASIDARPERWRRVLCEERFRRVFLPGAKSGDEKACVRAFVAANKESALKKKPKDYEATHRDIELLKLRSFTIGKKFPESVFMAEDGQDQIAEIVQAMVPFITFLNSVVMPDFNLDSDSSSDEDDDDEEENGSEEEEEEEEVDDAP